MSDLKPVRLIFTENPDTASAKAKILGVPIVKMRTPFAEYCYLYETNTAITLIFPKEAESLGIRTSSVSREGESYYISLCMETEQHIVTKA